MTLRGPEGTMYDVLPGEEPDEEYSLAELAALFGEIGLTLGRASEPGAVFELLTTLAVERVPGAEHASITIGTEDHYETRAATSELVRRADQLQYELQSGPCVAAAENEAVYNSAHLATDSRWPEFGRRAATELGMRSLYAVRLFLETEADTVAAVNMYATRPEAFGPGSEAIGLLLATHGALAVASAASQERVTNLLTALKSNREIGVAMGILMDQQKLTRDQAFDLLRMVSQATHRKIAEIAIEVADTGLLPAIPTRRGSQPPLG